MIIDFTCANKKHDMACTEVVGVSLLLLADNKEAKEPSNTFNFLSKMNWICTYYRSSTCTDSTVTCRQIITKCPYKKTASMNVYISTLGWQWSYILNYISLHLLTMCKTFYGNRICSTCVYVLVYTNGHMSRIKLNGIKSTFVLGLP